MNFSALAVVIIVFQALGFGRTLPWSYLPFHMGRVLWFLSSLALLVWMAKKKFSPTRFSRFLPTSEQILKWAQKRWVIIAFAAMNLPYLAFSYFKFGRFGYQLPIAHLVLFLGVVPFLKKDRLELSFLFSLLFLAASILHFPLEPERSDMLAVIKQGLNFWGAGQDPYQPYSMGTRQNWLSYLPGTALLHWPAWKLDIDLRWNSFLFRAGWMSLSLILLRRMSGAKRSSATTALQFFALNPYLNFRHDLYFEGFLFLMASWFTFPRVRWLVLPLLVWTRQFAWVVAPFWLASEVLRGKKVQWKKLAEYLAGFILVSALFVWDLWGQTSVQSVYKAVFWFQEVITRPEFAGDYGLTFAPLFFSLGLSTLLQKIQGAFLLGLLAGGLLRSKKGLETDWISISVFAWVGFLMLNPHFWLYFWLDFGVGLVFIALWQSRSQELSQP